jgi:glycosyltransferase involved in cell wall biosynthesis
MKILTFADYYLPGFRAGGPVRTISAMVSQLPEPLQFLIVTRDRDYADRQAYPGVRVNEWTDVGRAKVLYLPKRNLNISTLVRLVRATGPDIIYANSLFSRITIRLLIARRLGSLGMIPIILAPRGELSAGALRLRRRRKKVFLTVGKHVGLFGRLLWQASTERERSDIMRALGDNQSIRVSQNIAIAPDIFNHHGDHPFQGKSSKRSGAARFVFLSRITPMKNLRTVIELIGTLAGEVSLDIFGPVDDQIYLRECQSAASEVRPNVKITWRGSVAPDDVIPVISGFDFFVLPTLGENFGHVILESLSAGCPVLLSDRTPWNNIEANGAGWILPLEQRARWAEVLQDCVGMDNSSHLEMRLKTRSTAQQFDVHGSAIQQNVALFEEASHRLAKHSRSQGS